MSSDFLLETTTDEGKTTKNQIVIKKYYNGLEVIDSGVIHSFNSQDIQITVNTVIINFKFDDDILNQDNRFEIKADPKNDKVMNIHLYNMNSPFYEGAPHPIHVANVGNCRVLISFFVSTIDKAKGARILQYSISAGV